MADSPRARRMAGRIKQIVAGYIESQIKDPRLGMVTVTDVQITGDLHDAVVFYTVYGDALEREESALALEAARGQIRSEVGRQTGVKFTPTVAFQLDALPDTAKHIEDLLAVARHADAQVSQVRQGAGFAGDPDPYRLPVTDSPATDVLPADAPAVDRE
jgi:ribosome-binding factor A